MVGLVGNWPEPMQMAPYITLLNSVSTTNGKFSLFLDTELLFAHDGPDYLAFYGAFWHVDQFTFGIHLEQVNTDVTFGPNAAWQMTDQFAYAVEIHHSAASGDTAIRVILDTSF